MSFAVSGGIPEMKDAEYRMLAELVRKHCGLHFGPASRFLLEKRVARRVRDLEITSFAAYHYLLRSGATASDELSHLIDELTTNETYFYRELGQLRGLIHEIVPAVRLERPDQPVRIWSAGCSSGEEPYTLAMLALEAGLELGRDLRIYASDISRKVLRKARGGVYREASFRETDPLLREKYFHDKDGMSAISDELKRLVDFVHVNLMDRSRLALLGTMDVILCRNVIIYFDIDGKRRVIRTFFEKLRPGGHLLLGHSESLINLSSDFQLRHLRSDLVYQRPRAGAPALHPWDAIAESTVAEESER
jgi:chemotaxis protein methyltransferase CheR